VSEVKASERERDIVRKKKMMGANNTTKEKSRGK
jgi:hypothetical protein